MRGLRDVAAAMRGRGRQETGRGSESSMHPSIHAKTHPDRAAYVMAGSGETVLSSFPFVSRPMIVSSPFGPA